MANVRDQIRMTPEEIHAFLDAATTLHVASINPDGAPHLVPMWFTRDGDAVRFWTFGKSQKARNIARDPRVTVMAETGEDYFELRGVTIRGRAEIVDDPALVAAFGHETIGKYFGGDPGAAEHVLATAPKRVLIVVNPERIASWDHRKLS